jgi:uncharacterized protein (TIGR02270 family)
MIEAAGLALAELEAGGADMLMASVAAAPERWRAAARALGLCRRASVEATLRTSLHHDAPAVQATALSALAFRGGGGELELGPLLAHPVPHVQAAAIRLAPLAGEGSRAAVQRALDAPSAEARAAAIDAGLALGLRAAWEAARRAVDEGRSSPATLAVLAMSGEPEDVDRLERAAGLDAMRRDALRALGLSGWPRAAELCLANVNGAGAVARLAGEAFAAITGLQIEGRFAAPEPDADELPEEDVSEVESIPGPEAELAPPDPWELTLWWKESSARFDPKLRYVEGRPFGAEVLAEAFIGGSMRRRHALAGELAVRSRGGYTPEPRTWAREQLAFQADRRLAARADFAQPFRRLLQA